MAERQVWCRVRLIDRHGTEAGRYSLEGYGEPDLTAVDVAARLGLLAGRQDQRLVLEEVCEAMARLLDLAGLDLPGGGREGPGLGGMEPVQSGPDHPGPERPSPPG